MKLLITMTALILVSMAAVALPAATGPFRLVVPGEKKPARNCFQVVAIDIKFATK